MALDKTFSSGEILSAGDVNGHLLGLWIPIDKRVIASGSPTTPVTFSSLDSNFRLFRLTFHVIPSVGLWLRLNNDSGSNYTQQFHEGGGSTSSAVRLTSAIALELQRGSSGTAVQGQIIIGKPSSSTEARIVSQMSSNTHAALAMTSWAGSWNNTASLLNRVDVIGNGGNFYGVVALEGMRGS